MLFQSGKVVNGRLIITESKEVDQFSLTSDCWLVQIQGLNACKTCNVHNTKECGGGDSLKKLGGKNIIRRIRKK